MAEKRELEERLVAYRLLQARLTSLLRQRDVLASQLLELQTSLTSIDEVEKSRADILFRMGSGAWTCGRIVSKKKLIIEVGAGIALEKSAADAKLILRRRVGEIQRALALIQQNVAQTTIELERLGPEIRRLAESVSRVGG
jgi:prefoldin alpha subunit